MVHWAAALERGAGLGRAPRLFGALESSAAVALPQPARRGRSANASFVTVMACRPSPRTAILHDSGERALQSAADARALRVEARRAVFDVFGSRAEYPDAVHLQPAEP